MSKPFSLIFWKAFYNGQIRRLKSLFLKYNDGRLDIQSVDASQGSEADCVIISCVRNNTEGSIGFLADSRRVNVALSRAREVLVLVGSHRFFVHGKDENWSFIAKNSYLDR